jgi:hypothetical protein
MQLTYIINVSIFSVPLDCIVSPWTAWSGPDQTGTYARVRFVTRPPINSGKKCPNLIEQKKGKQFIIYPSKYIY